MVMRVRNGVFHSHTETPLGIFLLGVLVRGSLSGRRGAS